MEKLPLRKLEQHALTDDHIFKKFAFCLIGFWNHICGFNVQKSVSVTLWASNLRQSDPNLLKTFIRLQSQAICYGWYEKIESIFFQFLLEWDVEKVFAYVFFMATQNNTQRQLTF